MKRRTFIFLLGSTVLLAPIARAEQPRLQVLGVLASASEARYANTIVALRKGLNESGFVEKKNLLIEFRWANFQYEKLAALAAELAKRPVDVIFATGGVVSVLAAKSATKDVPIVFANGSDPVQYGLVASLNRPGGNITGISFINSQLGPKRIQLLKLLNPGTALIAVLFNPNNPNYADAKVFQAAARTIGVETITVTARTEPEIATAFRDAVDRRADAMLVNVDALFNDVGEYQIASLAAQHRLPTMASNATYTSRGGLISYGPNVPDLNRQAGIYVARILRGEKPSDLPVMQPTTFALRINLKVAKALALTIPEPFLLLADEVIE
jgi:putative ABC transport system substrate-binding protein